MIPYASQEPRLPYPTKPLEINGVMVEEYVIPAAMRTQVLRQLYPFRPVPSFNDEFFDLHSEKRFRAGRFRVTREDGHNLLVSPFYEEGGGTVIDWFPSEAIQD